MRWLLSYGYAPAMLFGLTGIAVWLVQRDASPGWLPALLGLAVLLSFGAERMLPYQPGWNRPRGDAWRDLCHALVNEGLNVTAVAAVPLLAALRPWHGPWPLAWPLWAQLLLAVLSADAGITLVHWLSHHWRPLWRLHAVHHSVRRMYGFNGLMKHPLHQLLETLIGTGPLLLAGLPTAVAALLAFAVSVQLLLQHANVDMRPGPWDRLMAWAPRHRYHHQKFAGVGDVNFGLFTNLWDYLLGTAAWQPGRRFDSDDLGMHSRPDYPDGYLAQLREPFRRSASTRRSST